MLWVIVMIVIAVLGLATVVGYAIWLAHKASDVFSELTVVGGRLGRLAEIIGGLQIPEPAFQAADPADQDKIVSATNDVR